MIPKPAVLFARSDSIYKTMDCDVLEHPEHSTLWPFCHLPRPNEHDEHGFTISLPQWWFGHKAEKWTWLYICGMKLKDLPPIPLKIGEASHVIATSLRRTNRPCRPEVSKKDREATPPVFAAWLLEVARLCWKTFP